MERLKAELDTIQLDVQSYEAGLAAASKELNQVQLHLQVVILHEACASNKTQRDVSMTFKRAHNTVQKRLRDTPPFKNVSKTLYFICKYYSTLRYLTERIGKSWISCGLTRFIQLFPKFTDFARILFVSSCFGVIVQDTEHCNRLLRAQIQVNQQDISTLHVCLSIRSFFSFPPKRLFLSLP